MSIYTKRGDKGISDLYNLKTKKPLRIKKDDLRFEAIGNFDELTSVLGIVRVNLKSKQDKKTVKRIQENIIKINSFLAGCGNLFSPEEIIFLESEIDDIENNLPKLKGFVVPGNSLISSYFHLARSITRRTERSLVRVKKIYKGKEFKNILIYINRLSDLLFVLARKY